MNTSEYKRFLHICNKNVDKSDFELFNPKDLVHSSFNDIDKLRNKASKIRGKFLDNIVGNLLLFEKNIISNKGQINWCLSYEDFTEQLLNLLSNKKIKAVNAFFSNFTDELGLKETLKNEGISTFSKENKCSILSPDLAVVDTASMFSVWESIFEMELFLDSKIKIFILPINKFICNISDIDIFTHIYSIYKKNISFPILSNIFTPSANDTNKETYVFIVDNSRSNLLAFKEQRKALSCLDCGACKRVCPVYNTIKDESYNNTITGPIANVILPYLENYENHKHLSFNCLLCGNCSSICPVNISIPDLILENRKFFFENKILDFEDNLLILSLKKFFLSRKKMNLKRWFKKYLLRRRIQKTTRKLVQIPQFSKRTFNQLQQEKIQK
jgi:L-lactate dehydrogenase complex protein LldF